MWIIYDFDVENSIIAHHSISLQKFLGTFKVLIMLYSIYTILMIIGIIGMALTLNLLRINSVGDLLISNSVGENRRNMSLLQNF